MLETEIVDINLYLPDSNELIAVLDEIEQLRLQRFQSIQRKRQFLVGRYIARTLLARHLNVPPQKVPIVIDKFGKPGIQNKPGIHNNPSLFLNISHASPFVVIAIADCPVGIDIEKINNLPHFPFEEIATQEELQSMQATPENFYRLWTHKEAALKAIGGGFLLNPRLIHIWKSGCKKIKSNVNLGLNLNTYSLRELEVPAGYLGAICIKDSTNSLTTR